MGRWLLRLAAALIACPILYFAASLVGATIPGGMAAVSGGDDRRIGLLRGPIHYDLLLPISDRLRSGFSFAALAGVPVNDPRVRWLVVGWGARGFYTTVGTYTDLNFPALWHAVTGDVAVLHLDVAGDMTGLPGLTWLTVSAAQEQALEAVVQGTFTRDPQGAPQQVVSPGFDRTDAFFAAKGGFSLFHTCNAWIGESLRAAGISFGLWTPTPQSVDLALALRGRAS